MTAELVLGVLGATFASLAFLPQLVKIVRTRSAADLSMPTVLLLIANALTWLAYGVVKEARAVVVTNALMLGMLLLILALKWKFERAA